MWSRSHLWRSFLFLLVLPVMTPGGAAAQALHVEALPGGGQLILIADANATATSLAWVDDAGLQSTTAGVVTLPAVIARTFGERSRPAVLVAVGAAEPVSLRAALAALPPPIGPAPPSEPAASLPEGLLERRLAASGGSARLELALPLPAPGDPGRPAAEVLAMTLPHLLGTAHPGLAVHVEQDAARLELPVEPELAELALRRLRLGLAQLAGAPRLDAAAVAAARSELMVRRTALLERHPDGAEAVLAQWRAGGLEAVRFFLYGFAGVGRDEVAAAARGWLAQHPGRATVQLPPQVFDPRFAPPPERLALANDLTALVLEHAASPLATVVLQPVLQGDLDGTRAASVLARLAVQVRAEEGAPPQVQVEGPPARLALATAPEALGEALEVLQRALAALLDSTAPAAGAAGAGGRALDLLAEALALPGAGEGAPAVILRPDNLVLGIVGPDGEAAADVIVKFMSDLRSPSGPTSAAPPAAPVLRLPTGDARAALAVALPVEGLSAARRRLLSALLQVRVTAELPEVEGRLLEPMVPGRPVLVLILEAAGSMPALEQRVAAAWPRLTAPVREAELEPLRLRVATEIAAEGSGALGAARRLARAAAGADAWRAVRDVELDILATAPEDLSRPLAAAPWDGLMVTAAGPVPAAGLPR